jgi:ATP-dependent RNA helicase RhlE
MDFKSFNFHPSIASGIEAAGYAQPTPIQEQAIGPVLQGLDVLGLAQTGTGKTAAFVLPLLNRLITTAPGRVRALVIAPTRELAEQIHAETGRLARHTRLRSATVYGGVGFEPQTQHLRGRADIIVACPGRLLDHVRRGNADFRSIEALVIDEADQMFDMGFLPDIRAILGRLPARRQTLLFSATMPPAIRRLADEILRDPLTIQVGQTAPADTVQHTIFPVTQSLKTSLLLELLGQTPARSVLVFTRTKHRTKSLSDKLCKAGYRAACLQGNLSQNRRRAALDGFRSGKFQILVATDIAARGIDVAQVSHVVNFDMPDTPEAYIHRTGRTGRMLRSGDAFTLTTGEDQDMVRAIRRMVAGGLQSRTLQGFDYTARAETRAPAPAVSPQRARPAGGRSARPGPVRGRNGHNHLAL